MSESSAITPSQFTTFGDLLKFLRRRAGLSQTELSIGVGYSISQISRLENNERAPDPAAIAARFVSELDLEKEPAWVARLLELATRARDPGQSEAAPAEGETPPHNLPLQLTSFIGREREVQDIKDLLLERSSHADTVRLLTLTGPGGSGKTRLALRAASEVLVEFSDGVFFISLAAISDPTLVLPTVMQTLDVIRIGNQTPLDALKEHLRGKQVLLVLDNFEQVLDAAPLLTALLWSVPALKLLVTSRVILHLSGEREYLVPPLPVPDLTSPSLDVLVRNEAVALFVQRARAVRQDFQLTPANASAVAEICVRLDGLPLAIELAAARSKVLAPDAMLSRLSSRLGLLTGGARDLPARQQTLRNTIDWSYHLLPLAEKTLFARLGVFVGGWILDAAERVCNAGGDLSGDMVHRLDALLDHNLIRQHITSAGAVRFGMLETLREYALEQLAASGELETLRQQHADYYLALVEVALPTNFGDYLTPNSRQRIEEEQDNLWAALAWSQGTSGKAQMALRLAEISEVISNYSEERSLLERVLAYADAEGGYDSHTRARVLNKLGNSQAWIGDYAGGELRFAESLALFQELGDRVWTAATLERWGWVARERGETSIARHRLEQALALAHGLNDNTLLFVATNTLAETMTMQGDTVAARRILNEILPIEREVGERWSLGWTLNHLGHVAQIEGEYAQATRLHAESLLLFHDVNEPSFGVVEALHCLGETALAQGDAALAAKHLKESLKVAQKAGFSICMVWCLAGLAGVAVLNQEPERAALLWGAAEALRHRIGAREGPATHATHERLMTQAHEQLGDATFEAALAEGRELKREEAIAYAMQGIGKE